MGDIERRLNKSAWKKGFIWGTEIDVNVAGTGILPLNAGVPKLGIPPIEEESAVSAFQSDVDQGDYPPVDFALDFDARYEGLGPIIAQIFGTAGTPQQQDTTAAWLHTVQLANKIAGLFGTYATEKLDKIHVVPSVKPYKLTYSLSGGLIKVSINMRGDNVIDDSSIISSMSSVTTADKHNRILARQGLFRMNAQSGAALTSPTDDIKVKNYTLEIERKLDTPDPEVGSRTIVEPREEGKPVVKLTMEFNRMDTANKAYFSDWKAETEKKMDIKFTGALIESTYYYYKLFQFPRMKIEDIEYPDANVIPAKMILRGIEADSAPTGMTGITKPVQLDVMNKRTTDMLA